MLAAGSVSLGAVRRRLDDVRRRSDVGAVTSDLVDTAHSAGLAIYCWTLAAGERHAAGGVPDCRPAATTAWGDWRRLFSILLHSGVDGVFADHPDLAVAVRDGPLTPLSAG